MFVLKEHEKVNIRKYLKVREIRETDVPGVVNCILENEKVVMVDYIDYVKLEDFGTIREFTKYPDKPVDIHWNHYRENKIHFDLVGKFNTKITVHLTNYQSERLRNKEITTTDLLDFRLGINIHRRIVHDNEFTSEPRPMQKIVMPTSIDKYLGSVGEFLGSSGLIEFSFGLEGGICVPLNKLIGSKKWEDKPPKIVLILKGQFKDHINGNLSQEDSKLFLERKLDIRDFLDFKIEKKFEEGYFFHKA